MVYADDVVSKDSTSSEQITKASKPSRSQRTESHTTRRLGDHAGYQKYRRGRVETMIRTARKRVAWAPLHEENHYSFDLPPNRL